MLFEFTLAFGLISIILGVIGFTKKGSKASLIAGGISGLLLLVSAYLMNQGNAAGPWLGGGVGLLLLGRFLPAFLKTKSLMPAGIMAVLSLIEVALVVKSKI